MKIEKLPRDFVYTDRRTLDDFLRSDDLNKELYKVYLRVKDRPYYRHIILPRWRCMTLTLSLMSENGYG